MSSSSEYEDVDMDSSGSESDIESGERQFNTKTPSKKEQEKASKYKCLLNFVISC